MSRLNLENFFFPFRKQKILWWLRIFKFFLQRKKIYAKLCFYPCLVASVAKYKKKHSSAVKIMANRLLCIDNHHLSPFFILCYSLCFEQAKQNFPFIRRKIIFHHIYIQTKFHIILIHGKGQHIRENFIKKIIFFFPKRHIFFLCNIQPMFPCQFSLYRK